MSGYFMCSVALKYFDHILTNVHETHFFVYK